MPRRGSCRSCRRKAIGWSCWPRTTADLSRNFFATGSRWGRSWDVSSTVLMPEAPAYPAPVRELDPPPTLHVRGVLPAARGIAVVGTREPTDEALAFTTSIVGGLVVAGFAIWSGGAFG